MRPIDLIGRNIRRNPKNFVFSSIGIVLGIATFVFFTALGVGVRVGVLERIFVVDQLEIVPRTVEVGAFQTRGVFGGSGTGLDEYAIADIRAIPGVRHVYPKQHIAFPAYATGGEAILGESFWTELIGEGLPPELIREELGEPDDPWTEFTDWEAPRACQRDDSCPPGHTCDQGTCAARPCTPDDEVWTASSPREVEAAANFVAANSEIRRRNLITRDVGDIAAPRARYRLVVSASSQVESAREALAAFEGNGERVQVDQNPCDEPSYCLAEWRVCQMPVPVLMSYTLLELYNGNVQTSLAGSGRTGRALPRMTEAGFIGFTFGGVLGQGFLGSARGLEDGATGTRTIRLRIVGFSQRAIPVGVTVPLPYVQRWNAEYAGAAASEDYHALLVVTDDSRTLHHVAHVITEDLGYQLDAKYEQANRASMMITLVTAVLALLSLLIVGLAALNIMHTFLMVVAERRKEIGVLRALGATRGHIYAIILGESAAIAISATTIALALAFGLMHLADAGFATLTPDFPFKPDTLFVTPLWLVGSAFLIAGVFCTLGAWLPALRAARMDPAEALRS